MNKTGDIMIKIGLPKKTSGRLLAITTTAALAATGSLVAVGPADAVSPLSGITDANLATCVTLALQGQSLAVSNASLSHLTGTLNCANDGITDLTGIASLTGITGLNLSGDPLADITGLSGLTQLLTTDLSDTGLNSVTSLTPLTNLLDLDLSGDPLTSVTGLSSLTHLLNLDLSGTGLTSLNGLQGLTGLLNLDLSGNNGLSLQFLPNLLHVLSLDLANDGLTSVAPLVGSLGDITQLILSGNPLTDPADVAALQNTLHAVTTTDLQTVSTGVSTLLNGLTGNSGLLGGLFSTLGQLLGSANLSPLVTDLAGTSGLNLPGLISDLGLGDTLGGGTTTVSVPPTTTIVTTPAGGAGTSGSDGSSGSGGSNGTSGSNGTTSSSASITMASTPTISGTRTFGATLTANPGNWDAGTSFTYQWFRGASAISGATGVTYKLAASDVGTLVSVHVTGSKPGATSVTNASAQTTKIAAAKFKHTTQPKVTGKFRSGHTLKAKSIGYSSTVKIKYQWYRGSKKISKATHTTYKLISKDKSKKVVVKITITKAGYSSLVRASKSHKIAK